MAKKKKSVQPSPRIWVIVALLLIPVLLAIGTYITKRVKGISSGVSYYVDCNLGNDDNSGLSVAAPWKTVVKAKSASLNPGDQLLFKRGCTWTHAAPGVFFEAKWNGTATSPITIGAYGEGAKPVFQSDARGVSRNQINLSLTGSYMVVEDIRSTTVNPYREPTCVQADGTPVRLGWYNGFAVSGTGNTLQDIEADNMSLAVHLADSSSNNKVLRLYAHDLNTLWRLDLANQAMGALGVNLHGNDNEVAYSTFERNAASCIWNGSSLQHYSAPFEIYNANRSYVHHNKAYGHRKHYEMGKDTDKVSADNVLAYNLFVSDTPKAVGPNIHGLGNVFGPVDRTHVYNNTVILTGAESQAIVCNCTGGAYIKNNIFIAEWKSAFYDGVIEENNNLYWDFQKTNVDNVSDPYIQFGRVVNQTAIGANSIKANPLFVNSLVPGGDYHLTSGSPARDRGAVIASTNLRTAEVLIRDMDGKVAPFGIAPDMGAYEYGALLPTAIPTPTLIPTAVPTSTPRPTAVPTPVPTDVPMSQIRWIQPFGDAHVTSANPGKNVGYEDVLWADGSPKQITYMKFDLNQFSGLTINEAMLVLPVTSGSDATFTVRQTDFNWEEGENRGISYNRRPSLGSQITTFSGQPQGAFLNVNLTSFVRSNAGKKVSIAIETSSSNAIGLNSRENTGERPRLRITFR